MLGQMVTATVCPKCGGLGEVIVTPCPSCGGDGRLLVDKTYQVDVPAGVDTGSTLRLSGRGAVGPRNGAAGDLYVHLRVAHSELFQRDGDDLVHVYTVSIAQAALGTRSTLATPDGDVEVVVQPGTQPGRELVFRNKGVPRLRGRGRGDLRVLVHVEVPTRLTDQEAELLRKLAELRGEQVGVPEQRRAVLADQVRLPVTLPAPLRTGAAHVFVDDLGAPELDDRDHHHLARVLRLRDGQPVTVSDGRGRWRRAIWRGDGVVADGDVHDAAPVHLLTIAAAIPKGDRLEWMVQKLTEVGVGEICLVDCARSVVRWNADRAAAQRGRLERIVRDAAMQSRRVWLPAVRGPVPLADVLHRRRRRRGGRSGRRRVRAARRADRRSSSSARRVVGILPRRPRRNARLARRPRAAGGDRRRRGGGARRPWW